PVLPRTPAKEQPEAVNEKAPTPADSSAKFKKFMPFIFQWEGETYENDPDDPGGETKFGIDKRSHPNVDIKNLTKEVATAIYWEEWKADGCLGMPSPYAEVYFNCAVNMGLGRARQFGAASQADANTFIGLQEAYYRRLAQQPKRAKYLNGWLNRTKALRARFDIY
ncbi:MAG: hypothetical protein NTY98_06350, partial [Verrucomicrobia bacterium]|nr:hypothetical protein [Verrucomicrobiota bacterium]